MKFLKPYLLTCCLLLPLSAQAEKIAIAAAADLKFAMDEIISAFRQANPGDAVDVIYGSSGKFHTQIRQGAPYDLYFSADIALPRKLANDGLAAGPVRAYAVGRIVLWSTSRDATKMTLDSLTDPQITRIAIANPQHAPYGQRAAEALRATGVWDKVAPKLVYGENIAQTAQFVQSGNAQVGIIALALAVNPQLVKQGGHTLIPEHLHAPLEQGFIITKRAAQNVLAQRFAEHMNSPATRATMTHHGFRLPGAAPTN